MDAFRRNGLINFAAAAAFLLMLSLVPFLLFLLALLGFLQLEEVWREDVAPEIRDSVSAAAFRVLDDTATRVLTEKQGWWVSAGFALTLGIRTHSRSSSSHSSFTRASVKPQVPSDLRRNR